MKIDVDYFEYKETIADNMKLVTKNHDLKKEVAEMKAIINMLEEKNKLLTEVANEKQNRIDRAMTYNNYLREKCSYRLNDGHLRKMKKILLGEETQLEEVPRMGVDKE